MFLKNFLHSLADFFLPPQCLLCRSFILSYSDGYFCKDCLDIFYFNNGPICLKCGILFESMEGEDHMCSHCIGQSHFFDRARALGPYEGMLRKAIHFFKYDNKSMLAAPLGEFLSKYGAYMLDIKEYELIIPVPLHPLRLRHRGFNQSLMLARRVGKAWNVEVSVESLKRVKGTIPQTKLSVKERRKNISGAFSYRGSELQEKKVLLVDDVYTSGSTVNECAKMLKIYGALKVDILTLARTRRR